MLRFGRVGLSFGALVALAAALAPAACFYDWTPPPSEDADGGGTRNGGATDDGTTGKCRKSAECASGETCRFADGLCGTGQSTGTCAAARTGCAKTAAVCGCSGRTFVSVCAADQGGDDVDARGGCVAPTGTFPCGGATCATTTEICVALGKTSTTKCEPIAGCAKTPDCTCVGALYKGCTCSAKDGALLVDCP